MMGQWSKAAVPMDMDTATERPLLQYEALASRCRHTQASTAGELVSTRTTNAGKGRRENGVVGEVEGNMPSSPRQLGPAKPQSLIHYVLLAKRKLSYSPMSLLPTCSLEPQQQLLTTRPLLSGGTPRSGVAPLLPFHWGRGMQACMSAGLHGAAPNNKGHTSPRRQITPHCRQLTPCIGRIGQLHMPGYEAAGISRRPCPALDPWTSPPSSSLSDAYQPAGLYTARIVHRRARQNGPLLGDWVTPGDCLAAAPGGDLVAPVSGPTRRGVHRGI